MCTCRFAVMPCPEPGKPIAVDGINHVSLCGSVECKSKRTCTCAHSRVKCLFWTWNRSANRCIADLKMTGPTCYA